MDSLSLITPKRTRRRFSPEFKASIVAQCRQPGVSVARIALDNDLNANLVRRWVSQAREVRATPGFMPISRKRSINPIYNQGYGRAMLISHILFGGFPHDAPWCQS